jgi:Holliday junction resolvase
MGSTPEGAVKRAVKSYLDKIGVWHFSPVSNGMGAHGIPDIIACWRGRFVGIEVKAPGKRANTSELQKMQLASIAHNQGIAVVVDDVSQLVPIFQE